MLLVTFFRLRVLLQCELFREPVGGLEDLARCGLLSRRRHAHSQGCLGRRTMAALRKSIGPLPLVAMGAAGIIGTSWIYTNGEFFAAYGAGGEIFGLAIATVLASFVAM